METTYQWKQRKMVAEEPGAPFKALSQEELLMTPYENPDSGRDPFNFHFDSVESAMRGIEDELLSVGGSDWDIENWVLVKVTSVASYLDLKKQD